MYPNKLDGLKPIQTRTTSGFFRSLGLILSHACIFDVSWCFLAWLKPQTFKHSSHTSVRCATEPLTKDGWPRRTRRDPHGHLRLTKTSVIAIFTLFPILGKLCFDWLFWFKFLRLRWRNISNCIYLSIDLSLSLFHLIIYLSLFHLIIYLSIDRSIYLSLSISIYLNLI